MIKVILTTLTLAPILIFGFMLGVGNAMATAEIIGELDVELQEVSRGMTKDALALDELRNGLKMLNYKI